MLLFLVQGVFAQAPVNSDSLRTHPPFSVPQLHKVIPSCAMNSKPRMEDDGLVVGNTKYCIRIMKPDTTIDYRMLKVTPDMSALERMPMARPQGWVPAPDLKHLVEPKENGR